MRVLLASTNAHKLDELRALFTDVPGLDLALAPAALEVEETGQTFAENAHLKASAYARAFDAPALADDSGLAVEALGGRPGVYSARYAPTNEARIAKLLAELADTAPEARGAAFVCAMAVVWPDGRHVAVEGRCEGTIAPAPRGTGGFGYDPVFYVPALGATFGEASQAAKNERSHRAIAARLLKAAWREQNLD